MRDNFVEKRNTLYLYSLLFTLACLSALLSSLGWRGCAESGVVMPYVIVSFVAMWLVLKTEGSCHLCHYAKSWFPFWNGSHPESALQIFWLSEGLAGLP